MIPVGRARVSSLLHQATSVGKPSVPDDGILCQLGNRLLSKAYCETEPCLELAAVEIRQCGGFESCADKAAKKIHLAVYEQAKRLRAALCSGWEKAAQRFVTVLAQTVNSS